MTPNPSVKRTIVQEGIPDVMPPEMRCLGWQDALARRVKLSSQKFRDENVTPNFAVLRDARKTTPDGSTAHIDFER